MILTYRENLSRDLATNYYCFSAYKKDPTKKKYSMPKWLLQGKDLSKCTDKFKEIGIIVEKHCDNTVITPEFLHTNGIKKCTRTLRESGFEEESEFAIYLIVSDCDPDVIEDYICSIPKR